MKSSVGDIRFINNGSRILLDKPVYYRKSRKASLVNSSFDKADSKFSLNENAFVVKKNKNLVDSIKKYPLNRSIDHSLS